jgi:pimeloyl-ACP methyl ester carboxylesterase
MVRITRASAFASLLLLALASMATAAAQAEDRYFDSDGTRIRYTVSGLGDPIVLVHGFTSSIEGNWGVPGIIETLAQEFKVIALDARGHGKSDKPHDPAAYGPEMGDDVVRLLDHLGFEKAHVVGYSMGGFLTLELLTRHPERFITATIAGAGWNPDDDGSAMQPLIDSLEAGHGITPLIERLTPEGRPAPSEEQLAAMNQMVLASNDPLALAAVLRGGIGRDVTAESLAAIEVPVLAVVGDLDPLREAAEQLVAAQPAVELHLLEGRDHMTAVADPDLVAALRDFIIRSCKCA